MASCLFEIAAAARRAARRCRGGQATRFGRAADRADFIGRILIVDAKLLHRPDERFMQILGTNRLFAALAHPQDRKTSAEGTSVSVRVDLGVPRRIKNKTSTKSNQ